jgi:crossover junction endodeoxyribonuclease RusA
MKFTIPGKPVPKQRPRVNTKTKTAYTPEKTVEYEKKVGLCALKALREASGKKLEGNVRVMIELGEKETVVRVFGQSMEPHTKTRGDLDNYAKSILDGMQGVLFDDDRQVSYLEIWR